MPLETIIFSRVFTLIVSGGLSLYLKSIGSENSLMTEIGNAAFGEGVGGSIADLFKEGSAAAYEKILAQLSEFDKSHLNHDLHRAARKAQLLATFFACRACLLEFAGEERKREEKKWLAKLGESLKRKINNLPHEVPQTAVNNQDILEIFNANDKTVNDIQQEIVKKLRAETYDLIRTDNESFLLYNQNGFDLLKDKIENGWTEQLTPTAPEKFYDWFSLVCGVFNDEYKNPRVTAAMQKRLNLQTQNILSRIDENLQNNGASFTQIYDSLAGIDRSAARAEGKTDFLIGFVAQFREEDFALHKITHEKQDKALRGIDEIKELLQEDANLSPAERAAKQAALVEEYLQSQTDKYAPSEFVGDIFNKDKFFVDRVAEQRNLLEWLFKGDKILILKGISGNGKTALMTEILQQIAPDANLRHKKIKGVLTFYFRDESRAVNFLDVCKKADARLEKAGKPHSFAGQYKAFKKDYPNELPLQIADNLIRELSTLGEVLFVFDNFESALTERKITDEEIRAFVQLVLSRPNNLRLLLTSQVVPQIDGINLPKPYDIGDLPINYAEDFLRRKGVELRDEEAVDCGLAEAADADLTKLFEIIQPSPMTLVSFVGYLKILCETEGKVFADVLADGLKDFPAYDADDKNKGARYFIRQQYLRLTKIEQLVLKALSIFGRAIEFPVLKSILPLSLDAKTIVDYLKGNSLVSKVGRNRYELLALPKEVIANLPDDDALETRRLLHQKAAVFYYSIRKPVAESYTREDFAPYFSTIDHLTDAGNGDTAVKIFNGIMWKLIPLGFMNEVIGRSQRLTGKLGEASIEANNFLNMGLALEHLGRLNEAITEYDKTINIYRQLIKNGRIELANNLVATYGNKGVSLRNLGKSNEAIDEYDKAIELSKPLVDSGQIESANSLALIYMDKGNALEDLGKSNEAIDEFNKAIELRKPLIEAGHTEFANDLAKTYTNKGIALASLGKLSEAIDEFNKAIEIRKPLLESGRIELADNVAMVYMNKGNALASLSKSNEAVDIYGEAIKLWEDVNELYILPNLVTAFRNRIMALIELEDWERIAIDASKAFIIGFQVLQGDEVSDHFKQLIGGEIGIIIHLLSRLSAEKREEIYRHAGENGKAIKQFVEDFEKNQKKS